MAFKLICLFGLLASTQAVPLSPYQTYSDAPSVSYSSISSPQSYEKVAAPLSYSAPIVNKYSAPLSYATPIYKKTIVSEDYSAPAHYNFGYSVEDPHTGDIKNQQESREGDVVKGSYSLVEADGSRRIVEYTADAHNGFNAIVHKEPAKGYAQPAYKAAYSQSAYKVATPVSYSAPVAYSQPAYVQPAIKNYAAPIKVASLNKISYSSAPEVSYSSVSAQAGPSYYH